MKKIFYLLICFSFMTIKLIAQQAISSPDRIWTSPAIYTMDEEVTWYFDFANAAQVSANENLYLWIWAPRNPTNEPIPLKNEGGKIWSITLTPTLFFDMSITQLFDNKEPFYFLIRDQNASRLTTTLSVPKVDFAKEFVEMNKIMDYAPGDFGLNKTISILFNSNLAPGFNPAPSTVHMHGGINDWDAQQQFQAWIPEIREKTKFKHLGNGIYKKDIHIQSYFNVEEDYNLQNLVFLAVKYNGDDANPDWAGASVDFKILAPNTPPPPSPKLSFFPIRASKQDIFTITREHNDRGQRLFYKIVAANKTLNGELQGAMASQSISIDFLKELKDVQADKIEVLISDQNGREIYKGDISLVKPDQLTK